MRYVAILHLIAFACVVAQPNAGGMTQDRVFNKYSGHDKFLQEKELMKFWLDFDDDGDGQVTKDEFDSGWQTKGFPNPQSAPVFFIEMDRVADEILNLQDFSHIFDLFDENGDGEISPEEFKFNWLAFFDD